jgi:hypothetical protein
MPRQRQPYFPAFALKTSQLRHEANLTVFSHCLLIVQPAGNVMFYGKSDDGVPLPEQAKER